MNHVDEEKMISGICDDDRKHLNECQLCQENLELLQSMANSKNSSQLLIPPPYIWERIESTRKGNGSKKINVFMSVAASILVGFVGIMTWKTHLLHQDIDLLISQNRSLELQITQNQVMNYQQAEVYEELWRIENKLISVESIDKQKNYLKQRRLTIQKIIDLQQGVTNESYL